jgi:membrane-bound lytic murein transglycosylase B
MMQPSVAGAIAALLAVISMAAATAAPASPPASAPASYEAGRRAFVADMVRKHGFSSEELAALMADARYQQRIVDAMDRPYEGKPWRDYRKIFLTTERIQGGIAFRREKAALLERAQAAYGVPPEIIVAIIGIETNYGRNLGDHRVLDALSTLGFAYPRRADFFRGELEQFLLLTRDERVDARAAKGSYAGAVGKPQFIPSSYRSYAVDFDNDGRRDLWQSNADVIGSVGNYLAQHGWRRGEPIAVPALLRDGRPAGVPIADKRPAEPHARLSRWAAVGVEPAPGRTGRAGDALADSLAAALIELDGVGPEYWLGFDNFYAITRYNHSNLYAMAVFQLSLAIAEGLGQQADAAAGTAGVLR